MTKMTVVVAKELLSETNTLSDSSHCVYNVFFICKL